ncbi:hypothetical protein P8452_54643 [Trifolium repens]|nr:hypothetical protein P8452_54643 [Trifolium repens]
MAEELGRQPTVDEVFLRTHIRKKDSDWVDLRSKNTYDTFQTKLNRASEVLVIGYFAESGSTSFMISQFWMNCVKPNATTFNKSLAAFVNDNTFGS